MTPEDYYPVANRELTCAACYRPIKPGARFVLGAHTGPAGAGVTYLHYAPCPVAPPDKPATPDPVAAYRADLEQKILEYRGTAAVALRAVAELATAESYRVADKPYNRYHHVSAEVSTHYDDYRANIYKANALASVLARLPGTKPAP